MSIENRRIVRVKEVREEAEKVRTLVFHDTQCAAAQPGQFMMIWAPGIDEVPMSVSGISKLGEASVTVEAIGEASSALCGKKAGDEIGVMGPLGRGFSFHHGEVVMIAGGMGVIPLAFLAEQAVDHASRVSFVLGAKTRAKLVFVSRLQAALLKAHGDLIVTTDDGSVGRRGTAVEALEGLLGARRPDFLYACGPDVMIAKTLRLAERHAVPMEASLQAYVKCALGLCGSCCIGSYLVCKDGPVFSQAELGQMPGLGLFRRDSTGARVPLRDSIRP